MTLSERLQNIQESLKSADVQLIENVENTIRDYQSHSSSVLTNDQLKILDERRANHLNETSASYSLSDVKQELIDKYGLPS